MIGPLPVSPSSSANSRVLYNIRVLGSPGVTLHRNTAVRLGKGEERR